MKSVLALGVSLRYWFCAEKRVLDVDTSVFWFAPTELIESGDAREEKDILVRERSREQAREQDVD